MDGEVLIVDEHTGRLLAGRRYNEGMHQAIEAKEGVEIQSENQTLATITLQNYFRMYDKLAGMTGTALTEAAEFMPDLQAGRRADPDQPADGPRGPAGPRLQAPRTPSSTPSSTTSPSGTRHGQPVLVGTTSVEKSEYLAELLRKRGRPARGAQRQAARARGRRSSRRPGRKGAVTVATNMAGRGTDIMLGGNAEFMAVAELQRAGPRPGRDAGGVRGGLARRARSRRRRRWRAEHDEVVELGRPLRAGHRAARVAPHRQPAARPLRPAGRPGREPVLPVPAATT